MRSLVSTIAFLTITVFANGLGASAVAAEQSEPGITLQESRQMADAELAGRLGSMLAQKSVDLDRTFLSDGSLSDVGLALRPSASWNGLCIAQIIQFEFQDKSEHPRSGPILNSLSETTRYKIRGNPDQNAPENENQLAKRCAEDHPFKDAYFTAPDWRTAQNAGFVVLTARAQARSGHLPFTLGCTQADHCKTALSRIAESSTDTIVMVEDLEKCRPGRACIKIVLLGKGNCLDVWFVFGRYVAPPGKEWGMIVPNHLNFKTECAGPAL